MEYSFESAMERLEEITEVLMEQLPLAQSLEYYKEAAELISFCDVTLKDAALVVEEYKGRIAAVADVEPKE